MLLNLVGPLSAVVAGTFVLSWITDRVSRRRASTQLRQQLAFEMTEAAYGLYFGLAHHRRQVRHVRASGEELSEAREALDAEYVRQRVAMGAIQARLDIYFNSGSEPSRRWHRVIDLLTVLHFTVVRAPDTQLQELRQQVEGAGHTGLSADDLKEPALITAAFEQSLLGAVATVLRSRLSSTSSAGGFQP